MFRKLTHGQSRATQLGRQSLLLSMFSALCLVVLAATVPLALALPVDPTWIPGLYDNADYDEAVDALLAVDAAAVPVTSAPRRLTATPHELSTVERASITSPIDRTTSRAPPLT
jgi:hypothetical protein